MVTFVCGELIPPVANLCSQAVWLLSNNRGFIFKGLWCTTLQGHKCYITVMQQQHFSTNTVAIQTAGKNTMTWEVVLSLLNAEYCGNTTSIVTGALSIDKAASYNCIMIFKLVLKYIATPKAIIAKLGE